jgi:hypothetical protein
MREKEKREKERKKERKKERLETSLTTHRLTSLHSRHNLRRLRHSDFRDVFSVGDADGFDAKHFERK